MKFLYFLFPLVFLLATSTVSGQRLKDKRAKITYVSIPEKKLPDDFTTYSVNVYGRIMVDAGSNANAAGNRISMDAFKRVNAYGADGGGHLRIVVNTGSLSQGRADMKSQKNTYKDKKTGKETVTYEYWYEVPFSAGPSYTIYDPEGNILDSGGASFNETKGTRKYSNSGELGKNYGSLVNGLKRGFAADVMNNIINRVNSSLAKNFDFKKTFETPEIFLIVSHDTEADYEKYYEQINKEWKELDAATPTAELKVKFGDALAFYEKEAEKDFKDDKKLSRLFEASNYNAALLNFYLDDFEKTVRYANRVIAAEDGKHKKSSDLIERVQAINKLMELHGVNTLHYSRDVSNALAPAAMKALEMEQEALENANDILTGSITLNGETIEGTFLSDKEATDLDFSKQGKTKFIVQTDGDKKEYDLSANEISAFSIGSRNFVKMTYSPCAKGKSEPGVHILEEVYGSEKITLYKYYPTGGALSDAKTEFAYKKSTEETPVSLLDTKFLIWKKGLANYFSDCADLKTMCEEGEIENEQESLLKAARIYAEVCQ